jgi:hypothetical protein
VHETHPDQAKYLELPFEAHKAEIPDKVRQYVERGL